MNSGPYLSPIESETFQWGSAIFFFFLQAPQVVLIHFKTSESLPHTISQACSPNVKVWFFSFWVQLISSVTFLKFNLDL